MARHDGRKAGELRPVSIVRGYISAPAGAVLISTGKTMVLCTASWVPGVPEWKKGSGTGWLTAEYDMLPAATGERRARNRTKVDGRTQEIQRLVGRSLRTIVDLVVLGENSIYIDCDVLQADGGTRTASITGAYVALCDAVTFARKQGQLSESPIRDSVAAVSIGLVGGRVLADLDYREDSTAEVDMNVVMTGSGKFIEVQGTGERTTFDREQLDAMLAVAAKSIRQLLKAQSDALKAARPRAK